MFELCGKHPLENFYVHKSIFHSEGLPCLRYGEKALSIIGVINKIAPSFLFTPFIIRVLVFM